jgi:proton-dependent oligopeptide transporter, POT family
MSEVAVKDAPAEAKPRHPKELYILFATEMWERFGFYTTAAIMTLYLQRGGFGWTRDQATSLWSNYMMFVYFTPLIGGYLADRFLGFRKSVLIGGIILACGYAALATGNIITFYPALALIFTGNGFFKPNVTTMVGNLYTPGSKLRDAAYNIFYMGINFGAFLGPIVAEAILQRVVPKGIYDMLRDGLPIPPEGAAAVRTGYLYAFWAAASGMTLGTLILTAFYRRLANADIGHANAAAEDPTVVAAREAAPKQAVELVPESSRIGALLVIYTIVIVFWMVFHQNGTTMTYWADGNTDWKSSKSVPVLVKILSLGTVDAARASGVVSNAINAFWVIVLSLPLIAFWNFLRRRGLEPSTPTKMAIGMMLTATAFVILYFAATSGGDQTFLMENGQRVLDEKGVPKVREGLVSPWWLIMAYCVLTLGELLLSPMGLSLVSKVAPTRFKGMMMGGWFVATAIGNKLTMIGLLWTRWYHSSFWLLCASLALFMAIVLLILLRPLKRAMPGV